MPKDFASRSRTAKRKPAPRKTPTRRTSPVKQKSVLFHGPSFSSGALIGAAIVLAAAYAPEFLRQTDLAKNLSDSTEKTPTLQFEFPQLLRDTEVQGDPSSYSVPKPSAPGEEVVYRVQAASFRKADDADQLRALLLLQNLPVEMSTSQVKGQRWHRVVVGPFARKLDAERARTKLREQDLPAILMRSKS
jgi:cell division septation protein DedD